MEKLIDLHVLQQYLKLQTYSFQFPRYSFARLAGSYAGPSYKQVWLWIWIIKNQAFYKLPFAGFHS